MPNLPDTSGLPVWAQVLVSILICIATLTVAVGGYRSKTKQPPTDTQQTAVLQAASLMDNMTMRGLSDAMAHLSQDVISLERELGENTHWVRSKYEQDREICQRLRELRDAVERQPK